MAGTFDLHKGITSRWDADSLDAEFTQYWAAGESARFNAFQDGQAAPENPFPYCVFEQEAGVVITRMSGEGVNGKQHERDVPLRFRVYSKAISGVDKSAKEIASELAEKILESFGGHPTVAPGTIALDNGSCLQMMYENDFGVDEEEDVYQWQINYTAKLDVPVVTTSEIVVPPPPPPPPPPGDAFDDGFDEGFG